MGFVAAARSSVSDQVFGQLRDAILAGVYAPEASLPSERELAGVFEVNRHAVREALRRLQQLGLVRVAQGGATRVLDWREHAGLDLAMALTTPLTGARDVLPVETLVRDVVEMRACLGADAARLCASRGTDVAKAAVVEAVEVYARAAPELERMGQANIALWRAFWAGPGTSRICWRSTAWSAGHLPWGGCRPAGGPLSCSTSRGIGGSGRTSRRVMLRRPRRRPAGSSGRRSTQRTERGAGRDSRRALCRSGVSAADCHGGGVVPVPAR
jgi:GntR family transcriptional repressor for pyruvate dehydrogenase complex